MLVETTYSGYKDFGGVTYPSHIVQTQDGYPALDITVSAVTANPAVNIDVPQNVRNFQPPPIRVDSQKMADGVYYLTGTTHHSLAIELQRLQGYEHMGDMTVVYLPNEKLLAEPDAFTPPAQVGAPLIPPAVVYAKALNDNIKRLKLDVQVITPLHGNRTTTVAELEKAAAGPATN